MSISTELKAAVRGAILTTNIGRRARFRISHSARVHLTSAGKLCAISIIDALHHKSPNKGKSVTIETIEATIRDSSAGFKPRTLEYPEFYAFARGHEPAWEPGRPNPYSLFVDNEWEWLTPPLSYAQLAAFVDREGLPIQLRQFQQPHTDGLTLPPRKLRI